MMRWFAGSCGLVLALAVCLATGCNRQCFLSKEAYESAHGGLLPPSAEHDEAIGSTPLTGPTPAPPTVNVPDRPPRYLSLQEAIAIALESGTASARGTPGQGIYDTTMVSAPPTFGSSTQTLTSQTDYLRVLALQPALAGADMEAALSRFDADWITSMNWTTTDNLLQGLNSFNNGTSASFQSSIIKQLASGGFVSTTFQQNYQLLSSPPSGNFNILNPLYTSSVILGFEQPLLRNYGVRINQLLSGQFSPITGFGVPGQNINQYASRSTGLLQSGLPVTADGILIARLRFDQTRADFERAVNGLVLNAEVAYWNLYNAYGQLYSFEESLRVAHRAWMIAHAQLQAGKINAADYAPVRGQYEDFRSQRAAAMGQVLDAERNLRYILGLPGEDGTRIVPVTPPTLAHLEPDWLASLHDTLNLRPELVLARDNLRLAQYNLEVAENFLKPDLRFAAQYVPLGFGTTLQGTGTFNDATGAPQPSNALRSLADARFANWTIGLTMNVPLGFRLENSALRAARIGVAQNYYLVKDQEQRATSFLTQQYQKLQEWYKLIEARRAARKAYAEAVDVRFKKILAGSALADISFLDFQNKLATAQVQEYQAIAEYNNTLARFEWAKGTVLKYNNVHVAEGPLPQCAQVRAVEHERERSRACVLRERPDPLLHPGRLAHPGDVPFAETPPPAPFADPAAPPVTGPGSVEKEKVETLPTPRPETAPPPKTPPAPPAVTPATLPVPVTAPALPLPAVPFEPAFKATPPSGAAPQLPPALPPMTVAPAANPPAVPSLPALVPGLEKMTR